MKKISVSMTVLFLVGLGAACTIHLPYDVLDEYDAVLVRMEVTPDDAEVLLNGRLIGVAYEFSTPRSALRLASRRNEIIFKKQGYGEESVDLSSYSSRNITLRINLEQQEPKATAAGPAVTSEDEAYSAKTEPSPTPPPGEKPAGLEDRAVTLVILTVTPAEAAIYIDGKFWGLAPEAAKIENLRLRPGKYVFEAFKPGFKAYKKEITVPKGEKFALAIPLQK